MMHSHTVRLVPLLPLGALLSRYTMCGAGTSTTSRLPHPFPSLAALAAQVRDRREHGARSPPLRRVTVHGVVRTPPRPHPPPLTHPTHPPLPPQGTFLRARSTKNHYKPTAGNRACTACLGFGGETTTVPGAFPGAETIDDCVCARGYFMKTTVGEETTAGADDGEEVRRCLACETFTEKGRANRTGTNCSEPGLELATLPLQRDFWRVNHDVWLQSDAPPILGVIGEVVEKCKSPGVCLGTNTTHQNPCATGHYGVLCDSCRWPEYIKGEGGRCELCSGTGSAVLTFLPGACVFALIFGLVMIALCRGDKQLLVKVVRRASSVFGGSTSNINAAIASEVKGKLEAEAKARATAIAKKGAAKAYAGVAKMEIGNRVSPIRRAAHLSTEDEQNEAAGVLQRSFRGRAARRKFEVRKMKKRYQELVN